MKSSIAAPSLRNSGLLARWQGLPRSFVSRSRAWLFVPTGTVLLMTTIVSSVTWGASPSTTAQRLLKFAEPSSLLGVPTARNTIWAPPAPAARSVVKCKRPLSALRRTSSSRPGS